eukprot:365491_1
MSKQAVPKSGKHTNQWIYVPKILLDGIENDIKKMTIPQLQVLLRDFKKDNSEILITGTKQILVDRVLNIVNKGVGKFKPAKKTNKKPNSKNKPNGNISSNSNSNSHQKPSKQSKKSRKKKKKTVNNNTQVDQPKN